MNIGILRGTALIGVAKSISAYSGPGCRKSLCVIKQSYTGGIVVGSKAEICGALKDKLLSDRN